VTLKAVAWNMADRARELTAGGGACCLAFTPRLNHWDGQTSVDLEVADLQPGAAARLA
jgi:single-stranded-DNA-specific exonuclease